VPSIEEKYTPVTAPGLRTNPTYFHSIAFGGLDWRPARGYARTGGFYEVRYHNFAGVDHTTSFNRMDTEVIQHIPILRETWVLSLRGRMQTTLDGDVPYLMMPALGSGSTLRAYHSRRFSDLRGAPVILESSNSTFSWDKSGRCVALIPGQLSDKWCHGLTPGRRQRRMPYVVAVEHCTSARRRAFVQIIRSCKETGSWCSRNGFAPCNHAARDLRHVLAAEQGADSGRTADCLSNHWKTAR